ncbi:MAG: alpha/beta hydrolase [Tissierellia bacterium]|nr:alpha/beta hydrolase [Tissierellia bacterium]
MEKKKIQVAGISTAYVDRGSTGAPVAVVLHGWGANIESVFPIIQKLEQTHRVLAYDAPGHGDSEEPQEVFGTWDYAQFLLEFLETMDIHRATFLGHSFGGKTLTIFAAEHPQRVDQLILVDASGVAPRRGASYYIKVYRYKALRYLYEKFPLYKPSRERLQKFYARYGSDDYQNSSGIMRKIFVKVVNENTDHYFPKIQAAPLLIWGRWDDATPLYMAEVFEEKIPGSGLVILEGGHYSYLEDYGTFVAVLDSYLSPKQ